MAGSCSLAVVLLLAGALLAAAQGDAPVTDPDVQASIGNLQVEMTNGTWSVGRSQATPGNLTVAKGATTNVTFSISVASVEGRNDYALRGQVNLTNTAPQAVTRGPVRVSVNIESEDVTVAPALTTVNCGSNSNADGTTTIPSQSSILCSFYVSLQTQPNANMTVSAEVARNATAAADGDYVTLATSSVDTNVAGFVLVPDTCVKIYGAYKTGYRYALPAGPATGDIPSLSRSTPTEVCKSTAVFWVQDFTISSTSTYNSTEECTTQRAQFDLYRLPALGNRDGDRLSASIIVPVAVTGCT